MQNKRGQGLVTGLIIGIIGLVITVIVGFVIVQTLNDAQLLSTTVPTTQLTVVNETQAWANGTAYPLDKSTALNSSNSNFVLTEAWANVDGAYDDQLNASALSLIDVNATGFLSNNSQINATRYGNLQVTYTHNTISGSIPFLTTTSRNLSANLSEGVGRVAEKIPTILKIAAVVLLLGVLVFLVAQARRMGFFDSKASL